MSTPAGGNLRPGKVVTVLSISGSKTDQQSLTDVFRHTRWVLLEAGSCAEALSRLERCLVPVVLCDCTLPDGGWKDVLRATAALPHPPLLIVASRLADDRLWAEVIDAGGYDVLEKPFHHSELVRVVSLAWLAWRDQWQRATAGPVSRAAGTS